MPLTDNTWTDTSDDHHWDNAANWSLGVVAGPTHRAIIDTTGSVTVLPGFIFSPISVGALTWIDGTGDTSEWTKVTCLGDCVLTGSDLSIVLALYDIGGTLTATGLPLASVAGSDLGVVHLTGNITVPDCFNYTQIDGGYGTVTFPNSGINVPGPNVIGTAFTGALTADGVTVDLDGSELSSRTRLVRLNGGDFTNYTGGRPTNVSSLRLRRMRCNG
jgi:hypothetical protein